ncbi:MAG: RNA polymerase sigma factor [Phycisphaeraceae bacterium]|nr:RNA polymerase sigma factor [Phycisphaeraceae bacterium]MCW5768952.1 RNA polymerase sigma factor [Phycisphaeraceae bacterium]
MPRSQQSNFATRTTTRLLDALKEGDNQPAWAQIDSRYRPVIAGLSRRLGLSDADAEEAAQRTLAEFVRVYRDGRYDRSKGRLSSWILGIAHRTALRVRREGRRAVHFEMDAVEDPGEEGHDEGALRSIWTDERDRAILARAFDLLREDSAIDPRTILAFELVAMRGVPAAEVAAQCAMSVDQVYVAKTRMTRRLKSLVEELTEAFEEDV